MLYLRLCAQGSYPGGLHNSLLKDVHSLRLFYYWFVYSESGISLVENVMHRLLWIIHLESYTSKAGNSSVDYESNFSLTNSL